MLVEVDEDDEERRILMTSCNSWLQIMGQPWY